MEAFLKKTVTVLIGDPRFNSLEQRLFNSISLLNAVTNIGGAFSMLGLSNYQYLFWLHIITGIMFLAMYYFARFRFAYRALYWPFVLLMFGFLFMNVLNNAGSKGGAHYYFIAALVISVMLSTHLRTTLLVFLLACVVAGSMFWLEWNYPDLIVGFADSHERLIDVSGQFTFMLIFVGILVLILARSYDQERDKSDRLLLNILPGRIADELKQHEEVEPLYYESATVLFTDFVGFTRIAEQIPPPQLIAKLDVCFRNFDRIVKKHGLEKIKTIGDAYMAVGGVPDANTTHAEDAVAAALEIQHCMNAWCKERTARKEMSWQLRVGIHTGHLVAGVIGTEKFAYDVWGDTVNTASRLESSGVPGRINISHTTYELVKDKFACEYRGKVEAKNKGLIDMYFVTGWKSGVEQECGVDPT